MTCLIKEKGLQQSGQHSYQKNPKDEKDESWQGQALGILTCPIPISLSLVLGQS